jgi:formylglycine-generating enzyme required for sulfatase activity
MAQLTEIAAPRFPPGRGLMHASEPNKPLTGITWHVAHAYCQFLGKELPSSQQWVKAMRGGELLPDGTPNPMPRRNLPWGVGDARVLARLDGDAGVADVGTYPGDVSPYGVLDLAGNAQEWTDTRAGDGLRFVRGGGALAMVGDAIVDFMAIENPRAEAQALYNIGMRCAVND